MATLLLTSGQRVSVFVFDEATGGEARPATVRRMLSETHVKVRFDDGFEAAVHVRDVSPRDAADDDRRAA